jgi:hypothetical protein
MSVKKVKETKRFYECWYDEESEASAARLGRWDAALHAAGERDARLVRYRVAHAAARIPRRLGNEATPSDLAIDKKFWARAEALYRTLAFGWERIAFSAGDFTSNCSKEEQLIATRITWDLFMEEAIASIQRIRTEAITLTAQAGQRDVANRIASLYQHELDELERIKPLM